MRHLLYIALIFVSWLGSEILYHRIFGDSTSYEFAAAHGWSSVILIAIGAIALGWLYARFICIPLVDWVLRDNEKSS